ncbi:glycoside hydrolase family 5 protein [Synoicihabitans lomoniglobus]|uniref:Cellulase family glycosylhydrolase n=1 Tax=Synoicihabitans lomoniglobus TaxID=2909285 RepID=A0AAF0A1W6_9BACT|nr:glycoside hydrolase family 5 protein [Opitutaceae bacterium LMO-M01]WED65422.1 cellulase family glycosylhydrolase [Opitutaceae bacterium LMO-M01]
MKLLSSVLTILSIAVCAGPTVATAGSDFKKGVNISHWLAQHAPGHYATAERFEAEDAAWIADHGFDHVRIPVDGRILMSIEGKLITELLQPLDQALEWCRAHDLGVILDMHYLPGNEFLNDAADNALWSDPDLRAAAASLWTQVATHYRDVGPWLRYEILNEAVAPENEDLNILNQLIVDAIRTVDATRVLYVSSNRWGQFQTVPDLRLFDDPNVHYALHTYEPFLFTHQNTSWTPLKDIPAGAVTFPGGIEVASDSPLAAQMMKEHHTLAVTLERADVAAHYAPVAAWAREHGVNVVITEFGVYRAADPESTVNWIRANVELCEAAGFGWSVWDYQGGFAIRGPDGEPTAVYRGLFPER